MNCAWECCKPTSTENTQTYWC